MINKFIIMIISFFIVNNSFGGVIIGGTRFLIYKDDQYINLKIINDNENEYLIKSEIDDNKFIISPPLFLLSKNTTRNITIIPTELVKDSVDKIMNITITLIPKSNFAKNTSSVSLAVRNHFKLIFRHAELKDSDFKLLDIFQEDGRNYLKNNSRYVFTISFPEKEGIENEKILNISPNEKIRLNNNCKKKFCNLLVSFYNENNNVIKKMNLSYQ